MSMLAAFRGVTRLAPTTARHCMQGGGPVCVQARQLRHRAVSCGVAASAHETSQKVEQFIRQAQELCQPDAVHICTGTSNEFDELMATVVDAGTAIRLNPDKRPNSYAAFTDPTDVARAEADTFICSVDKSDAGPTNNWRDPQEMKNELIQKFNGCMRGRTMYVIPFSMGPIGSPLSKIGVEVTDSAFVAANMRLMTRVGTEVLDALGDDDFVPCMHSVGQPIHSGLAPDSEDYEKAHSTWPCNVKNRAVCHFPETREIWSFGSGYGGNSLLGKKCFALRIASVQARDEGWLAEHMLILGLTNPAGEKKYVAAAFPSACGKTNLAMMLPSLEGWKVECVGDDIAWMKFGPDGRLYAVNPENGFFGVAPGTSMASNPNAMLSIKDNTIFTNVALTDDGDVYWEGMGEKPTEPVTDWKGNKPWSKENGPSAHPNSRFTVGIEQCTVLDSEWNSKRGVPIDAIIFGGRRDDTIPLVYESYDWAHGTFMGATMRSNATSAADQVGLVNDPMAMKAFCGYNVKDYFAHWLSMAEHKNARLPKIFQVNWFQKDGKGKFMWPGFGENARVLEWIIGRVNAETGAVDTPIGRVPKAGALNTKGLDLDEHTLHKLLTVDKDLLRAEADAAEKYLTDQLCKTDATPVPQALLDQLAQLRKRIEGN